jgi:hypothetical protein
MPSSANQLASGTTSVARKPTSSRLNLCRSSIDQQPWPTLTAARRATVEYIAWCNGTRLHSALGYMTPDEFEIATDQEALTQVV